jgi:K+-sensing histidine kinase KdpD
MEFELFKDLTKFPFIWKGEKHNSPQLEQNKSCAKCKSMECLELLSSSKTEFICPLGFNSFSLFLKQGKTIFNGLITRDNRTIKKGRLEARSNYLVEKSNIEGHIKEINAISKSIDDGIKKNIRDNFTLFHDVRSSYGIAFSNVESLIFEKSGSTFYEKLQNCDQKIIDLYDSLDLVNSLLDLIDVMVNPAAIVQGTKKEMNIYKLTHKLSKLFAVKAARRELVIELFGNDKISEGYYHDSIKLVPIILIENAIKYSERTNKILITFNNNYPKIKFSISSYGLPIPVDERETIFDKQHRGSNASNYTEEGIGMGLYIAKSILSRHFATINYNFEDKGRGMGFNIFTVEI